MGNNERYFIKPGYTENPVATTMDAISGKTYWNEGRIGTSFYYQFHVYQFAEKILKKGNLSSIVDVGCGFGPKLAYLKKQIPNLDITGIDQAHPIEFCQQKYDFGTWLADDFENPNKIADIPTPDVVICADVIEHVLNPDNVLDYIRKISSRNTKIIISTPDRDKLRGKDCMHSPHPQHVREWNKEELKKYVSNQGFIVDEHISIEAFKIGMNYNIITGYIKNVLRGVPLKNGQLLLLRLA